MPDAAALDALLAEARDAGPLDRIALRDPIAAQGELAIEAMTDWLGEPRLAAFAVRVLERIGRDPEHRAAVAATLASVDREQQPEPMVRDLDAALAALGVTVARRAPARPPTAGPSRRPMSLPGAAGRGYWVMRTSPGRRDLIWSEAVAGRLRQGWGWDEAQNLDVIAEAIRHGIPLDEGQHLARRSRKMRTTERDGMRVGDIVVTPNLPAWGDLSVFRITGSYCWDPIDLGIEDRFGHVLPVELLAERVDRRSPAVSDALRTMLRPQPRLYWIGHVGGDVERLIAEAGVEA
jgi:hypothetical protein